MALPTKSELQQFVAELEADEAAGFSGNLAAMEADLQKQTAEQTDLWIKILTIFGGILGSLFITGFLFMVRVMESPSVMLLLGVLLLGGALFLIRQADSIMAETAAVCAYLIGLVLFAYGAGKLLYLEENVIWLLLPIALLTLFFSDKPVFIFLAILLLFGSLAFLIIHNKAFLMLHILTAGLAGGLTWLSVSEAKLIGRNRRFNLAFGPVRMGLLVSLLSLLLLLAHPLFTEFYLPYPWLSTIIMLACLAWVTIRVLRIFEVTELAYRLVILVVLAVVFLPTIYMPSIVGAMLILLLSFYTGHRAGIGLSAAALVYFVILFYYDLHLTLLTKSIILMLTGALFLAGYMFLHRKLKAHAEV